MKFHFQIKFSCNLYLNQIGIKMAALFCDMSLRLFSFERNIYLALNGEFKPFILLKIIGLYYSGQRNSRNILFKQLRSKVSA